MSKQHLNSNSLCPKYVALFLMVLLCIEQRIVDHLKDLLLERFQHIDLLLV